jgi:hypothetical protein
VPWRGSPSGLPEIEVARREPADVAVQDDGDAVVAVKVAIIVKLKIDGRVRAIVEVGKVTHIQLSGIRASEDDRVGEVGKREAYLIFPALEVSDRRGFKRRHSVSGRKLVCQHEDIAASTAGHQLNRSAAIERIIAVPAREDIGPGILGARVNTGGFNSRSPAVDHVVAISTIQKLDGTGRTCVAVIVES